MTDQSDRPTADTRLFIGGAWRDGGAGSAPILNPATGVEIGRVAHADEADIDDAAEHAMTGFGQWRDMPPHRRGSILRKAGALLRQRAEAIAAGLTADQGKPLSQARIEVLSSAETFEWFADEGRRSYGMVLPGRDLTVDQLVIREPVGPVLCLAPWNFPISLSARKVAPALAAGCSVILKAPEEAPSSPAAMIQALHDAGVPAGVVGLLCGDPATISHRLIAHPAIRKISFTGSTEVGKRLASLAGTHMKRMTMELGGHAPVLVLADADVPRAAKILAQLKFRNAGQVCTAPTRFLVEDTVRDRFLDGLLEAAAAMPIGDGADPGSEIGPLANPRRIASMQSLIADAVERGGTVRAGGRRIGNVGNFFESTVLCDVPASARIMNEEPFGPIAIVNAFSRLDDAVTEANRLPFGLAAYVFTGSLTAARRLSRAIECGKLSVNNPVPAFPETPLGGVKDSGVGVEGGPDALAAYQITKFVTYA